MPGKQLMCICEICNCGRHRCPHKPAPNIMSSSNPPCTVTEYSTQFQRYQAKRRPSFRPKQQPVSRDAKMECSTTNHNDFVSHPITPPPKKPVVTYQAPDGVMNSSTEYKELYQGKWALPATQIRPAAAKRSSDEPFNHQSTHTVEYTTHTLHPRENYGPKYVYETPKEPFKGVSTLQTDFVDFGNVQPPKSLKPVSKPTSSSKAFEAESCYRNTFIPPSMPPRFQRVKQVYSPPDKEFYGDTTFKSDFPARYGIQPAKSLKPPQAKVASDEPFEGKTTSRMSYTKWDLPNKISRPPTVFVPPAQKFSVHSTYKEDFPTYNQLGRSKSLKPSQKREQLAPFDGLTSHGNDYKVWSDVKPPSPIRLEKKYAPPTDHFNGISTFQAHYTGELAPRAASTKPQVPVYQKTTAMEDSTSYRESFSCSSYRPCPSASLVVDVDKHPGYQFNHEDENTGHKFFSPIKDSPTVKIAA